ncbi:hypothetical protein P7K49_034992 [Saguinus oedipus]|uniref:Uncharacterized protein n=1 Tax=Saguinus oedipus TaxID=9490 RepID=A0ABQ9TX49_SAGOE|nr:hypothetical protein P7K49_034992 [Saguinus oedipus]
MPPALINAPGHSAYSLLALSSPPGFLEFLLHVQAPCTSCLSGACCVCFTARRRMPLWADAELYTYFFPRNETQLRPFACLLSHCRDQHWQDARLRASLVYYRVLFRPTTLQECLILWLLKRAVRFLRVFIYGPLPQAPVSLSNRGFLWVTGRFFIRLLKPLLQTCEAVRRFLRYVEQADRRCPRRSPCCLCDHIRDVKKRNQQPSPLTLSPRGLPCLFKHLFCMIPKEPTMSRGRYQVYLHSSNHLYALIQYYYALRGPYRGVPSLQTLAGARLLDFLQSQGYWEYERQENYSYARRSHILPCPSRS